MCGIAGTTHAGSRTRVDAMLTALTHRGPDDVGVHADPDGGLTLGARRLSIIDVEGGHQPLANEDGSVWAALNGEIYNHPRLQERLRASGHRLATHCDTEVLVHLYEDEGDAFVHALEGMYAFALWDARRRRLVVGRDRFGEKPLFYREHAGGITFASELTALLAADPDDSFELDPAAVDAYFTLGYVPAPRSMLAGVRQLPPGHLLVWERDAGASVSRYWSPPRVAAPMREPDDDLVLETEHLLDRAVQATLISDVPLGVFLSGGLDSTLVAAMASRHVGGRLKTFTVGYDVGAVSETSAARRAAEALGSDHHELSLTEPEVATLVPDLVARLDQPLADQALVASHALSRFARSQVVVAVGGEGADELFGGYPRYRWLAIARRVDRGMPAAVGRALARGIGSLPVQGRARRLEDVVAPRHDDLERHLAWVAEGRFDCRDELYGERMRAAPAAELFPQAAGPNGHDVAGRFMHLDQCTWLPDDILAKADRSSMLASLEVRTPFLNRDLAELAASVPASVHLADGGKHLLRRVFKRVAPASLSDRSKTAFRVPAGHWLRAPLHERLREQVEHGSLYELGWFDRDRARELVDEHASARADHTAVLWPLFVLGTWVDAVGVARG